MPNNRIHPKGTTFFTSIDGSSYTQTSDLVSIAPPDVELGDSDDTDLSSSNAAEVTTPGWIKATEAELMVWVTKAQFATFLGYATGRTPLWLRIQYPLVNAEVSVGSQLNWQGYFKGVKVSKAEKMSEDKIQATITIKRTTVATFSAGS
jgi:hypothetical protein